MQVGVNSFQLLIELQPEGNNYLSAACKTVHACNHGSTQNDILICSLDSIGGIVADVILILLMPACFAKELLIIFTVIEGT